MSEDIKVTPILPTKKQSVDIINLFRKYTKSYRAISFLVSNKRVPTKKLSEVANVDKVSSLITTTLNPKLLRIGYVVCGEKPLSVSSSSERTKYLWSLCKIERSN